MTPPEVREIAVEVLRRELVPDAVLEAGLPSRLAKSDCWLDLVATFGTPAKAAAELVRREAHRASRIDGRH